MADDVSPFFVIRFIDITIINIKVNTTHKGSLETALFDFIIWRKLVSGDRMDSVIREA